ncbi:MAG: hypothetical protein ACRC6K_07945 [Fusobacteriaceae bacterium]
MKDEGAIETYFYKDKHYSVFSKIAYNNKNLITVVTNEINEKNIIDYSKQLMNDKSVNIHFFKNSKQIPEIPELNKKNYLLIFDLEKMGADGRFAHFYRTNAGYESYLKWSGDGSLYSNSEYLDVTDEKIVELFSDNKKKEIEKDKLSENVVLAKKFISEGYVIFKQSHQYYILSDVWVQSNAITKEKILIIMASLEKEKDDYMMVELFDYNSSKLVGEHGPFKGTKIY